MHIHMMGTVVGPFWAENMQRDLEENGHFVTCLYTYYDEVFPFIMEDGSIKKGMFTAEHDPSVLADLRKWDMSQFKAADRLIFVFIGEGVHPGHLIWLGLALGEKRPCSVFMDEKFYRGAEVRFLCESHGISVQPYVPAAIKDEIPKSDIDLDALWEEFQKK